MKISRRALIGSALGVAAAAAVGAFAFAGPDTPQAGPRQKGDRYAPGPRDAGRRGPGDMSMQLPDGRWHSHLLPFAQPFSSRAALDRELGRARSRRLIG